MDINPSSCTVSMQTRWAILLGREIGPADQSIGVRRWADHLKVVGGKDFEYLFEV